MIYVSIIVLVATALFCSSAVSAQETECWTNEAKLPCGKRCEEKCNGPLPRSCTGIQCEDVACRCKDGFARDPNTNQCVAKADCPVNKCDVGEINGACGRTCEGTCASPKRPEICMRIRCKGPSCRCDLDGGFVRNSEGKCVHIEEC